MQLQIIQTINKAELLVVDYTPVALYDKNLGYTSRTEVVLSEQHEKAIRQFFKGRGFDVANVRKQSQGWFGAQLWHALGAK